MFIVQNREHAGWSNIMKMFIMEKIEHIGGFVENMEYILFKTLCVQSIAFKMLRQGILFN